MPIELYEARQLFFRKRSSVPFYQLYFVSTWLNRVKFHLTTKTCRSQAQRNRPMQLEI